MPKAKLHRQSSNGASKVNKTRHKAIPQASIVANHCNSEMGTECSTESTMSCVLIGHVFVPRDEQDTPDNEMESEVSILIHSLCLMFVKL